MARADRHRTAAFTALIDPAPGLRASWERQPWVLRILRAFLGITFLYAGLQKFLDPNFLHSGSPDFIGSQLASYAQGSPIAPVLHLLNTLPVLTGVGVAVFETAIGMATLLGIAPATAAILGFLINLMLFLSATWRVHPYFLGSDSIYAAGWAAYLAGLLELRVAQSAVQQRPRRRRMDPEDVTRRQFVRGAAVAAGTVALSAMAGAAAGSASTTTSSLPTGAVPSSSGATKTRKSGSGGNGGGTSGTGSSGAGSSGTPIAKLTSIPVGGAIGFQDAQGTPAILVRTGQQQVAAFSRVCTHAGCLVGYDQQAEMIVCPCHGAEFDPKHGAQVVAGPAPTPLPPVRVTVGSTGEVVAEA